MPGPAGFEPGAPAPAASARAFQSRAMSGVDPEWGRRNGLTAPLAFSHNLAGVFPARLAAQHPEFFPLEGGRRFTPPTSGTVYWNPDLGREDVARYAAEVARIAFTREPERTTFSLGVNDATIFGESPEMLALVTPARWFRGRPDYSRLVYTFMNRAAEELSRTHPQKYLGALAYYWTENAPDFPVHRQVIPFLTADRAQGYDAGFLREEADLQRRWAAVAQSHRLGLYDYLYGGGFLVPRVHPHLIAENLKRARAGGFTDYYAEVNPNWGLDGPMPWIVAQLLLDPEQSVDGLLDEYFRRYFQEAAEPMREFFARCEQQWLRQPGPPAWLKHYRNQSQATLFPSAVCAELRAKLEAARRLAVSPRVQERVALVSDAFGVTERFVRLQEARAALEPPAQRGTLRGDEGVRQIVAYLDARKEFVREALRVKREQPLAFFPINFDDFLRDDPTFGAIASCVGSDANEWKRARAALGARSEAFVAAALEATRPETAAAFREILPGGGLEDAPRPPRTIAGLKYEVSLPQPWQSLVEPTEKHDARLIASAARHGERGLRISGDENTTVFQWLPAKAGRLYVARVNARGMVSPGDAVTLTLGWLDGKQRHLGAVLVARLPDGASTDWHQLTQGGYAPPGAAWVGIGIRVQHQLGDDWVECDDFSLRER